MNNAIIVLGRHMPVMSLISRTLRYLQVYCEMLPVETPTAEVLARQPKGIILAEGQESFSLPELTALAEKLPVLVLGELAAKLCEALGGEVGDPLPAEQGVTFGFSENPLFEGIAGGKRMFSGLRPFALAGPLAPIATATERCIGFRHQELPLYAMQYPIEHNDPDAAKLLHNFACLICGAKADWSEDAILERAVEAIRSAAGAGRVLCAVSGGVDSSVCAKLAHMAVGDQLDCVFIDTGFFRQNEPAEILSACQDLLGLSVRYINEKSRFMEAVAGVSDRAQKETQVTGLINRILLEQHRESERYTIVLGTNLNDRLYGAASGNHWALPETSRAVEPMAELFKEEVRSLAQAMSMPPSVASRQPFPTGGLALRIFGEVTEEKLTLLRAADALFVEEVCTGGHGKRLWQYYAEAIELPPGGKENQVVALRALQLAQTGTYAARLPYDLLERVTHRILAEVPGVSRVIYDLTPGTR